MDRVYVMQLVRSFQVGELDRRAFLKRAGLALGSMTAANALLAACTPITAPNGATVPPPVVDEEATAAQAAGPMAVDGLIIETVEYPDLSEDETLTGHLARMEDGEPRPAVIVLQEWWGLDDHIKDVTNRFAAAGYTALAPDLYKGQVTTEPNEARKLVMELDMDAAVEEIRSAVDYLQAQDFVAGDQVGLVGFCMGGRLTLMTALLEEDLGAAVAFYGSPLAPEDVAGVTAPIMGHYGTEDGGIPVEGVNAMEEALDAAGIENDIYIYEGAEHAFFNDTRPSYAPEAADEAWTRTLAWFEQYLGS